MRPAPILFACMFAAQSAFLTLSPTLPDVARDLDVPLATAGQLGTAAGLAGAAAAIGITVTGTRLDVRLLLLAGLAVLAAGSTATAAAPGFAWLLAAQLLIGAGVSAVVAGAFAAVAVWAPPDERATVLAWAVVGQPMAWVLGMPLIGVVAHDEWRLAWLAVPGAASLGALGLVVAGGRGGTRPAEQQRGSAPAWRRPAVRTWAVGELLGFVAWNGTLLYAGGLLAEGYGLAATTIGVLLGIVAAAYLPAVWLARPYVRAHAGPMLAIACIAAALLAAALGAVQVSVAVTAAILAALMALNGLRGIAGNALGLAIAPDHSVEITGLRAVAMQAGRLLGAALGGLAFDAGGFAAMTAVFAVAYALAALPHVQSLRSLPHAHRDPRSRARGAGRLAAGGGGRAPAGAAGEAGA